ncbi:MAG: SagB/ThcOx family dehydrogenase [Chloroflexaceae bacterium]|nr:SagB/ThcOx family dehydrogenase [Chloroflexaceae bacterium]
MFHYHERSKHALDQYARGPGYLDWESQPDPFRRYAGAPLFSLDEVAVTAEPPYHALFAADTIPPRALDNQSIAQLLYDSLALSSWKAFSHHQWSLRVNPSSGNLHPTEGYLLAPAIEGLHEQPACYHYAPFEHNLELRYAMALDDWDELTAGLPAATIFIGLTSIYWRESWKYGERAFRYCQHDVGHAIGTLTVAAAVLGWQTRLLDGLTDDELSIILGIQAQQGIEAEHSDCLLAIYPSGQAEPVHNQHRISSALLPRLAQLPLHGTANRLSETHMLWPAIDTVAEATRRKTIHLFADDEKPVTPPNVPDAALLEGSPSARDIIRRRRSAVDMDGQTSISRAGFYTIVQRLQAQSAPFTMLGWPPQIQLVFFVHRVENLMPGLYLLVRNEAERQNMRETLRPEFVWQPAEGCPQGVDLIQLDVGSCVDDAWVIACNQRIAADGAFTISMLATFEAPLLQRGAWFYRRLLWEAGLIGQLLYLEAEAQDLQGTGIGCFFDDLMHHLLGITDRRYQSLYHFAVGQAVHDDRLQTLPAYWHRANGDV